MKAGPQRAQNPGIPGGKSAQRPNSTQAQQHPPHPHPPPRATVKGSAARIHHGAISSQRRTPSAYRSILFPADKAFPNVKNKPIKANSAYRNKSDESIQAHWYCLVFYPRYPSVLNPDQARS